MVSQAPAPLRRRAGHKQARASPLPVLPGYFAPPSPRNKPPGGWGAAWPVAPNPPGFSTSNLKPLRAHKSRPRTNEFSGVRRFVVNVHCNDLLCGLPFYFFLWMERCSALDTIIKLDGRLLVLSWSI